MEFMVLAAAVVGVRNLGGSDVDVLDGCQAGD
jgi:hypothetical protein